MTLKQYFYWKRTNRKINKIYKYVETLSDLDFKLFVDYCNHIRKSS